MGKGIAVVQPVGSFRERVEEAGITIIAVRR